MKILNLIESVTPKDDEILNEIDARVWCFFINREFNIDHLLGNGYQCVSRYTRSRDAIKGIRPNEWLFNSQFVLGGAGSILSTGKLLKNSELLGFRAFGQKIAKNPLNDFAIRGKILLTEELAELHVVIQAIQWERENATENTD